MTHKVMARINALTLGGTGEKSLAAMEKHGKREDLTSRARRVSRRRPVVHGTLDLRAAYDRHVDGARSNAALNKPVLHMLMKFPDACLRDGPDTPASYRGLSERARKKLMMEQAVAFANRCYGGNAVFAGRVDRDEDGELNVDVFMTPRYVKRTKTGKMSDWISTTKHGKELAEKHGAAIRRRMPKGGDDLTGPRAVGIALQEELRLFHLEVNGIETTREPKIGRRPDRRAIEDWQATKDAEAAAEAARADADAARVAASSAAADHLMASLDAESIRRAARQEAIQIRWDARAVRRAAEREVQAVRKAASEMERRVSVQSRWDTRRAARSASAEARLIRDAAAATARAQAVAYEALAREIEAGTIRANGREIVAVDRNALAGGMPAAGPAIRAAVSLVKVIERERAAAEEAWKEADAARIAAQEDRKAAAGTLDRVKKLLAKVSGWLERRGIAPAERREGERLMRAVGLEPPKRPKEGADDGDLVAAFIRGRKSAPPEEPPQEPGGPRF